MLPKSITTAIGMGISEELGGYVTITVAVIIITGVLGNICGEAVCKIFKITNPVAKGIALGNVFPMPLVLQKQWKWARLKGQ